LAFDCLTLGRHIFLLFGVLTFSLFLTNIYAKLLNVLTE
jgi:hypothetical protein